jgi:xylulokinase
MAVALGIDIGTTSTIGILIDTEGETLATASRPVTLSSPRPGWAEEDPEEWWRNLCAICPELVARAGIASTEIGAVGITGMLPALVLLDAHGRLVRPSIQQSDGRCGAEVEALGHESDEASFLARTGQGITQQLIAPKLRWLARHEPQSLETACVLLGAYDFIAHRLTGSLSLERNWALEAGFLDLRADVLATDLVALGGIDPALLPPLRSAGTVIGTVTKQAAAATGLATGTPVVAGCADHVASAWVAGVQGVGDCLLKFGGAGDILLASADPVPDRRLFLDLHILPGLFMPNGCMAASGSLLNWFVRELGGGRGHAELDGLAAATPPGAAGLVALPYALGEKTPIHDPQARGVFMGLGLHHQAGHLWRALLEAVALGFRHHIEVARQVGYPVTRIVASDGGAQSRVWMQIAADALQAPVRLLNGHPGSCLGAAWVAAKGAGLTDDWQGVARFIRAGPLIEPQPARAAIYDEAYALYRETYEALRPLFRRCDRIVELGGERR